MHHVQTEWVPDKVVSDTHFFHSKIINLVGRINPESGLAFSCVSEMNELIKERWNDTVGEDDDVLHLGDLAFFYQGGVTRRFIESLNGRITLVSGNHDKWKDTLKKIAECRNVKAIHGRLTCRGIVFTHKPSDKRDAPNCHGHLHDLPDVDSMHFNACVERHGYRPVPSDDIFKWARNAINATESTTKGKQ